MYREATYAQYIMTRIEKCRKKLAVSMKKGYTGVTERLRADIAKLEITLHSSRVYTPYSELYRGLSL